MEINRIIIKNRVRKELGDLQPLKNSLQKHGLIHPITINSKNILIAGERRLTAAKELGWKDIDVIVKDISELEALEIELEENIIRQTFTPLEIRAGLEKQSQLKNRNIFKQIAYFFKNLFSSLFYKK